jgi:hypothetical protein
MAGTITVDPKPRSADELALTAARTLDKLVAADPEGGPVRPLIVASRSQRGVFGYIDGAAEYATRVFLDASSSAA